MTKTSSKSQLSTKPIEYTGLLAIGDPHVEARQPGFRCDDYPNVILQKLRWSLNYAIQNRLLPMILGDLFDKPRDNPNWLIHQLIEMMQDIEVIGIFGNHDCGHQSEITENESLSILAQSGCLRLVTEQHPWLGEMNGRQVLVGGSSYRQPLPETVSLPTPKGLFEGVPLAFWLTHHDIDFKEMQAPGMLAPFEIENLDYVINGHLHRQMPDVQKGQTTWMNPGNISRRKRSQATLEHKPAVLRIDIQAEAVQFERVMVPHQPSAEVFYEAVVQQAAEALDSQYVSGLRELQMRKTDTGAGLHQFLDLNLTEFDSNIANVIKALAKEVTETEETHV